MTTYATPADLAAWLEVDESTLPSDAGRQLRRASELIDAVVTAPFGVDGAGLPTDTDVLGVLRDATCAQVEFWIEVGEAHDIDGLHGTQITVTGYSGKRAPEVAPRALRLLAHEGLLSNSIGTSTPPSSGGVCC